MATDPKRTGSDEGWLAKAEIGNIINKIKRQAVIRFSMSRLQRLVHLVIKQIKLGLLVIYRQNVAEAEAICRTQRDLEAGGFNTVCRAGRQDVTRLDGSADRESHWHNR
jgi:hypothetical protein